MKTKRFLSWLLVLVMIMSMIPASFAADASTSENKIVTVNYLYEDNTVAANSWTASIGAGESLEETTITHPTVVGYQVSQSKSTVGAGATVTWGDTGLTLKVENIASDITINVVYVPAEVNYTVKYFQQNVDNDNYTLAETATLTGYTGDDVSITAADNTNGFYLLPYEVVPIAADGSTVVEVYMDRNYYLMTFNLGGGYGVEPIFARYGAAIGDLATPTRPGYTFTGWDKTIPATMPAENTSYTAQWQAVDTAKVSVVFWGENANDEGYSYLHSDEVSVKPGTELTYTESGNVCGLEAHTHSSDCAPSCGKTPHTHGADCYTLICTDTEHAAHTNDCYSCNAESHTHSTACYAGVGSAAWSGTTGKPNNPSEGQVYKGRFGTYIYIKGTWYDYTGSVASGSIAPTTCGKTESTHTHTDSCLGDACPGIHTHTGYTGACYTLTCTTEEHTHSSACGYSCGYVVHTHDDSCKLSSGLDSTLWTYVRSDTVTVEADGSTVINVYYDRIEYTFTYQVGNTTVHSFDAKWGSDISDKWTFTGSNGTSYPQDNTSWTPQNSDTYNVRITMMVIMPAESITFRHTTSNNTSRTFHYYVASLPGATGDRVFESTNYEWKFDLVNDFNELYYEEDFFELEGFTRYKSAKEDDTEYPLGSGTRPVDNLYFYYTRNSYTLDFNNGIGVVKSDSVLYQANLGTYASYTPEMPDIYPVGSHVFAGWYQNPECTGQEVDLTKTTMPAANMILYAKWEPVEFTVNTYLDNDMAADEQLKTEEVSYSSFATAPDTPKNGEYTFVGWFYMENGVEKAFDFANMPITKDMEIYAKWSSMTLVDYLIQYQLEDGTVIADPIEGSALGGNTKTFDAKGDEELYTKYQAGYFPKVGSHSLTMSLEGSDGNGNGVLDANEYIFVYVQKDAVPYTVKYLDAETGEAVATEKYVANNRYAVVTEKAANVSGYLPDAYQKRLVVVDGVENILIFYYTKDATHALITEYHYKIDGSIETEYSSSQKTGNIGTNYSATNIKDGTIADYVYRRATVSYYNEKGELVEEAYTPGTEKPLAAGGLHFKFYYIAQFYVNYQSIGTTTAVDVVDSYNVTEDVHTGYLYGGIYEDAAFTTPMSDLDGNGIAFVPERGETYYVKEVPEQYLQPKLYYVYDKYNNNKLRKLYLISTVDNEKYLKVGFIVNDTTNMQAEEVTVGSTVYENILVNQQNSDGTVTTTEMWMKDFYGENFFPTYASGDIGNDGYLHIQQYFGVTGDDGYIPANTSFSFTPYYVTPDGVRVAGIIERTVYSGSAGTAGTISRDDHASEVPMVEYTEESVPQIAMLSMRRSFSLMNSMEADPDNTGGDDTTTPGGDDTTTPGGDDTTTPGGDDTTTPGGDDTTTPGGDDTTTPGGDDTTTPGGDDTTTPGGDDTTIPGGDDTTTPGGDDTTTPGGDDTTTPDDDVVLPTEFTITKVNGRKEVTQVVEAGDQTGMIDYAQKRDYVFAGWFADSALTVPADFSDVQSDMTVYAKYVSKLSMIPVLSGTPANIAASMSLSDDAFAEIGFVYEFQGQSGTVAFGEPSVRKLWRSTVYQYSAEFALEGLSDWASFQVTPYWVTLDGTVVYGDSTSHTCLFGRVF